MSISRKPIEMYGGADFLHSLEDGNYCVYESQECIVKQAIIQNRPILISIRRKPRFLIRVTNYLKLNLTNFMDNQCKKSMDKLYKWYPEGKNQDKNWNIYFTFELLQKL